MDEALDMAKEAIECHLEGMILDNQSVPASNGIEHHKNNEDYRDSTWAILEIYLSRLAVKTKRINITMPENIIAAADEFARAHHLSRWVPLGGQV